MADYTGHIHLDRAIQGYIERGTYQDKFARVVENPKDYPLTNLRLAKNSSCMCEDISEQMLTFFTESHPDVHGDMWKDVDPKVFGLPDPDLLPHTVARLYPDPANRRHYFTVDFTASQYDESVAFPHVCEFTE